MPRVDSGGSSKFLGLGLPFALAFATIFLLARIAGMDYPKAWAQSTPQADESPVASPPRVFLPWVGRFAYVSLPYVVLKETDSAGQGEYEGYYGVVLCQREWEARWQAYAWYTHGLEEDQPAPPEVGWDSEVVIIAYYGLEGYPSALRFNGVGRWGQEVLVSLRVDPRQNSEGYPIGPDGERVIVPASASYPSSIFKLSRGDLPTGLVTFRFEIDGVRGGVFATETVADLSYPPLCLTPATPTPATTPTPTATPVAFASRPGLSLAPSPSPSPTIAPEPSPPENLIRGSLTLKVKAGANPSSVLAGHGAQVLSMQPALDPSVPLGKYGRERGQDRFYWVHVVEGTEVGLVATLLGDPEVEYAGYHFAEPGLAPGEPVGQQEVPPPSEPPAPAEFVEGRVLIKVRQGKDIAQVVAAHGGRAEEISPMLDPIQPFGPGGRANGLDRWFVVDVAADAEIEAMRAYFADPDVEWAELDAVG